MVNIPLFIGWTIHPRWLFGISSINSILSQPAFLSRWFPPFPVLVAYFSRKKKANYFEADTLERLVRNLNKLLCFLQTCLDSSWKKKMGQAFGSGPMFFFQNNDLFFLSVNKSASGSQNAISMDVLIWSWPVMWFGCLLSCGVPDQNRRFFSWLSFR